MKLFGTVVQRSRVVQRSQSNVISWEIVVLFLYVGTMLFAILKHEPWRDEAQAWLIARDLPFISIFRHIQYDGTPALWHYILAVFAKIGFPYIFLNLINLLIISLAAAVFVYKAPFSKLTKILFIFSYYMAYEYSVIARSYGLSVLLLFLIATYYGDRFKKPIKYAALIFLLFNTNVHSFFIAISFVTIFLLESYTNKEINIDISIAVFTMTFGALLALLQLLPTRDNFWNSRGFFSIFDLSALFFSIGNAFFPHMSKITFGSLVSTIAGVVILFVSGVYILKNYRTVLFILLISYLGLFYIFTFKYAGAARHHGFILIMLIVVLWISSFYKKEPIFDICISKFKLGPFRKFFRLGMVTLLLNFSLALSVVPGVIAQYKEHTMLFSGSKEIAEYLKSNNLTANIIVAHRSSFTSAVLPYLPGIKFWYADIEQYGTYVIWSKKYGKNRKISFDEIENRINRQKFSESNILILLNNPMSIDKIPNYQLLKKVKDNIFGYGHEQYFLYRKR